MSQTDVDIEEYIDDTLEKNLESGSLSVGDLTIILTIRDALLENAHGMFLWVTFQIDSICSYETDEAILAALKDLPKDLPDTFNRILQKLQQSNAASPQFCKKIFDLVAAARRPFSLDELREALSVEPGRIVWDASRMINYMLKLLSRSCGSLVAVDEEYLTVQFVHHSVKQHLLSKSIASNIRKYQLNMEEADLYLGYIIVTYLHFETFDQQFTKVNSTTPPPQVLVNYPSAILGNLPQSSFANRLAVKLLRSRRDFRLDVHSHLKIAAGIVDESKEQTQPVHTFLSYAQEHWLFHTKFFKPTPVLGYTLWQRLIDGEVKRIELPWAPKKWHELGDEYMRWIIQNKHWALINQSLVILIDDRFHVKAATLLLEFLEKEPADMKNQYVNSDVALLVASYLNNEAVVLLSLKRGANVNTGSRVYGTALEIASRYGYDEIAKLLLENGADVNGQGEAYLTPLELASSRGAKALVQLLLDKGAIPNGATMKVASDSGNREVKRLIRNGLRSDDAV